MSWWLSQPRAEVLACGAWSIALAAAVFLTDSTVAFVAIMGTGLYTAIVYQAARRRWWAASGVLSLTVGILLTNVTAGDHSHTEHNVVFAISLATIAYYMVAVVASKRASERSRRRTERPTE